MSKRWRFGLGVLIITGGSVEAQTLNIDHQPVACAVAGKFPRLDARFAPAEAVAAARVVFQGQNPEWYSVAMKPEGASFTGVLPKPKGSLKAFRYYIEVTGKALGTNRTADYTTNVVDSSSACTGKVMAGALASASVILQGPAGVVALPGGFASSGVVAGSAAGSGSAAGAAGASAAGGGVGATALVLGGVAVAGGAVAVAAAKGGGEDNSPASGSSSHTIYGVSFLPNPPGMDVSVCAGRQLIWSSHNVSADANGNFNETWSVNEPNTMRVTGQVTATTFQATMACVNGARTGSISATGSNSSYGGSFAFGPSTGQVSVTKFQ